VVVQRAPIGPDIRTALAARLADEQRLEIR
jgi:hypothetical protein